jgi:hypothetical protein
MASIFSRDPTVRPPVPRYAIERIQREIEHLKKGSSSRYGNTKSSVYTRTIFATALCALLWLYFMDPFLYAFHKSDAIRTYLYLHNYGSEDKANTLAASGILSETEVNDLNHQQGTFQDYYSSPQQAEQAADSTVNYMNGLHELRTGQYERLDPIGKLRYLLFVRLGLLPPSSWSALNPSALEQ